MKKTCPICKEERVDSWFYKNPNTGKLSSFCRPCKREWERKHRVKHREEYRINAVERRRSNPDAAREACYRWREKNPKKWKAVGDRWASKNRIVYEAERRQTVRQNVFEAYGGFVCACCGEKEPMFLTIDHVENDGNKHRKELATKIGKGGTAFFDWLKRNKFPPGFQVLCRNCNWGKHANGGICPHRDPEGSTTRAAARTAEAIAAGSARDL